MNNVMLKESCWMLGSNKRSHGKYRVHGERFPKYFMWKDLQDGNIWIESTEPFEGCIWYCTLRLSDCLYADSTGLSVPVWNQFNSCLSSSESSVKVYLENTDYNTQVIWRSNIICKCQDFKMVQKLLESCALICLKNMICKWSVSL